MLQSATPITSYPLPLQWEGVQCPEVHHAMLVAVVGRSRNTVLSLIRAHIISGVPETQGRERGFLPQLGRVQSWIWKLDRGILARSVENLWNYIFIDVKNCRFNAGVTMTPIKGRKLQKFIYCILACQNFMASLLCHQSPFDIV